MRAGTHDAAEGNGRLPWAAVLFDLDGTLADTVDLILRCYRHTMTVHLGEALPDALWISGIGTPLKAQLAQFARDEDEAERMLETYVTFQRTIHDEMVVAYPGAVELTRALDSAGVPVGVVTSKRREMAERTLARCGLSQAYQVLVAADDVARGKPDPEPVWRALDELGLRAEVSRTLFVGDSPFDLKAGRRAGTRTAAALWGPFDRATLQAERPDYWLSRLEDVLELR